MISNEQKLLEALKAIKANKNAAHEVEAQVGDWVWEALEAVSGWDGIIRQEDFKIETFALHRASFAMRLDARVRVIHIPTNETSESGEHRSQHANRNAAWNQLVEILKTRPEYKKSTEVNSQAQEINDMSQKVGAPLATGLPTRMSFHENGEANSYYLADADDGKWLMALLVNGEKMPTRQVELLKHMVDCWNACEGLDFEVLEATKAQRDALLVQLERGVKLYETRALVAEVSGCGVWVNDSRDAIAACKTRPAQSA